MENRKVILTPEEESSLYTMMHLYKHNPPEELEKRLTEKMEPDKEAQKQKQE